MQELLKINSKNVNTIQEPFAIPGNNVILMLWFSVRWCEGGKTKSHDSPSVVSLKDGE